MASSLTPHYPVRLSAGESGATVVSPDAGSASTSLSKLALKSAQPSLLSLTNRTASEQRARIRLTSYAGLAAIREATMQIGELAQISIRDGVVLQSSGAPVALPAGASLTISGSFHQRKPRASQIVVEVVTEASHEELAPIVQLWTIALSC